MQTLFKLRYMAIPFIFSAALAPAAVAAEYVLCDGVGACGLVDQNGKPVFERVFESISPFHGDYALYSQDGRWALLDRSGKTVRQLSMMGRDLAQPEPWPQGTWLQLNKKHYPPPNNVPDPSNHYLLRAPDGRVVLDGIMPFWNAQYLPIEQRWPYVYRQQSQGDATLYDVYDLQGQLRVQLASTPQDNHPLFAAKEWRSGLWGYLDRNMNWVIAPQYQDACVMQNGVAEVATKAGRWLINGEGRVLNPFAFQHQYAGRCDAVTKRIFAVVSPQNGQKWLQFIDGKAVRLPDGIELDSEFVDGAARVFQTQPDGQKRFGVVGLDGRLRMPVTSLMLGQPAHGLIVDELPGPKGYFGYAGEARQGLLTVDGRRLLPAQYRQLRIIPSQTSVLAWQDGWGLLGFNGQWLLPPNFKDPEWLSIGYLALKHADGMYRLYTAGGKLLNIPPIQYLPRDYKNLPTQQVRLQNGEYGEINRAGQYHAFGAKPPPAQLAADEQVQFDSNGRAVVTSKKSRVYSRGESYLLIDKQQREIARFASAWPQYQMNESEYGLVPSYISDIDPCVVMDPVKYSAGIGPRIPAWCPQAELRAAVRATLSAFYSVLDPANAAIWQPEITHYRQAITQPKTDVLALSQQWQRRLAQQKSAIRTPEELGFKLKGKLDPATRKAILRLLNQSPREVDTDRFYERFYWVDANRDGRREVLVESYMMGDKYSSWQLFSQNTRQQWRSLASFGGVSALGMVPAPRGQWPVLVPVSWGNGSGESSAWRYQDGQYRETYSCSTYMREEENGHDLTFCSALKK